MKLKIAKSTEHHYVLELRIKRIYGPPSTSAYFNIARKQ